MPAYGPVAEAPKSPFVPSNVTKPVVELQPEGGCRDAQGSRLERRAGRHDDLREARVAVPSDCGAGIPEGTPIKFVWANLPESVSATGALESEAFASQAKQAAGIDVSFQTKTFNFLTSNYNNQNPAAKKYVNDWGVNNYGGIFVDYYPTQDGVMNTTGALNLGAYDDPTANKLMAKSIVSPTTAAIQTEVAYLAKQQPVLYFPVRTTSWRSATRSVVSPPASSR